ALPPVRGPLPALGGVGSSSVADPRLEAVRALPDTRPERTACSAAAPAAPVASRRPRPGRAVAPVVPAGREPRLRPRAPPRLALPRAARTRRLPPVCRLRRRLSARRLLAAQPRVPQRGVRRLRRGLVPVFGRPARDRNRAGDAGLPARPRDDSCALVMGSRPVRDELCRRPHLRSLPRGLAAPVLRGHGARQGRAARTRLPALLRADWTAALPARCR